MTNFQLPLSGSLMSEDMRFVVLDMRIFQLPLSGSLWSDDVWARPSLNIDFQLPLSGSPHRESERLREEQTFNSLSRDHLGCIDNKHIHGRGEYFQLPLSGSLADMLFAANGDSVDFFQLPLSGSQKYPFNKSCGSGGGFQLPLSGSPESTQNLSGPFGLSFNSLSRDH